jgi:hypothetical protein
MPREREAELLTRMRRDTEAQTALDRARGLYERWGARAKVLRMRKAADASLSRRTACRFSRWGRDPRRPGH